MSVPLVNKRTFTVWRMIPIPVPVDHDHFLYIDVRDSVFCLGQTNQYYFPMQEDSQPSLSWLSQDTVCTHPRTLLSTVATESCAVALLHNRNSLPPVCDTRLIRLYNTVWMQLFNNSWIFYAPQPDIITILCYDNSPVDVRLKGIGELQLHPGCTGYRPSSPRASHSHVATSHF